MRWLHLAVIILFGLGMLIFAFQNRELLTLTFLGFNARVPLAFVAVGFYAVGALTGGSLFALLRRSYEGYKTGTKT